MRTQTLVADRFGGWAQPWWFGATSERDMRAGIDAVLRLAHGGAVRHRLSGVRGALKLIRGK